MANTITLTTGLKLEINGIVSAIGSQGVSAVQTGASGKNNSGSIDVVNAAASIPVGNCDPEGATGVYFWLREMTGLYDVTIEDDASHVIGFCKAGKSVGPWLVDFTPKVKARVTDETPSLQVVVVQE